MIRRSGFWCDFSIFDGHFHRYHIEIMGSKRTPQSEINKSSAESQFEAFHETIFAVFWFKIYNTLLTYNSVNWAWIQSYQQKLLFITKSDGKLMFSGKCGWMCSDCKAGRIMIYYRQLITDNRKYKAFASYSSALIRTMKGF